MTRPRAYKTEAVVLRQIPLGEADRILTLYTPDIGKVRAVAKGVRRMKSRLGGHLELLNRVSVALYEGKSLDVVTEAQVVQTFSGLREDLEPLSRAMYIAELIDGFSTERSPNHAMYTLLVEGLAELEGSAPHDLVLRYFEMRVLDYVGYRPELFQCVACRTTLEPRNHMFSSGDGGVLCPTCRGTSGEAMLPVSVGAMKVLRFLQREDRFANVSGLKVSDRLLNETGRLLRANIRFLLERDLRSAEFISRLPPSG